MDDAVPVLVPGIIRKEYVCGCKRKMRIDHVFVPEPGPTGGKDYRHCTLDDKPHYVGPNLVVWEQRDGTWVPIE